MATTEKVADQARVEKFRRDLQQLRSRALRIQGEADATIRDVQALTSEFDSLTKDGAS